MKNKTILLLLSTLCILQLVVKANSVNIRIINNSNCSIYGYTSKINNGSFLIKDNGQVSKAEVKKGSTAEFSTGYADAFCGTDGYVYYKTTVNGRDYFVYVRFDVPYIGDNDFYYTSDAPFRMKHVVGGPGSNVTITFELTGGAIAVEPPAPPFDLPTSGASWLTGSVTWNEQSVGMPNGNPANAFDFEVIAPSRFHPNYPASKGPSFTEGTVSPESGTLTDYKALPAIKVEIKEADKTAVKSNMAVSIYARKYIFTISNLPYGIPLEIRIKPKAAFWNPGTATPLQPSGASKSKWCVYPKKTREDSQGANFSILGMWMNNDGTAAVGNATALEKKLLSKVTFSVKSDALVTGSSLKRIAAIAGSRPPLKATKVTAPAMNKAKIKMTKPM